MAKQEAQPQALLTQLRGQRTKHWRPPSPTQVWPDPTFERQLHTREVQWWGRGVSLGR
jgi:hypothetical protein